MHIYAGSPQVNKSVPIFYALLSNKKGCRTPAHDYSPTEQHKPQKEVKRQSHKTTTRACCELIITEKPVKIQQKGRVNYEKNCNYGN